MNKMRTPEVRFPEFRDEWEQCELLELLNQPITDGPHTTPELVKHGVPFISVDAIVDNKIDFSRKRGFITREFDEECSKKYKPQSEDVFLVKSGSTVGKVAIVGEFTDFNIWSPLAVMRCKGKTDPFFLYTLLQTDNMQSQVQNKASNGTQPNLSMRQLEKFSLMKPKYEEQKRIGEFFQHLDNTITLHQRKLDDLKNLKSGLLQKMFPQKGEKVPQVRFPGFTGDWEQRKFKDTIKIERGGSPRPIEQFITDDEDGLNWIKIGDAPKYGSYITSCSEKIKPEGRSKTREVIPGDLILSNSMSFGRPYIMGINGCIHDGWLLIRNEQEIYDLKFLCLLLGTEQMLNQYRSLAAGSAVNNLNKDLVGGTTVKFPGLEEQRKIGEFFEIVEEAITLHQRKIDDLNQLKSGLLQKMFVA